jgi:endonuclease YncB( thermonuclease family)
MAATPAVAAPLYGLGRAKDGDSLMVGQTEVRLFGIDAPEYDQSCKRSGTNWSCGAEAADHLSRLVTGKDVRCTPLSIDQHGRTLARCTVGTVDVNRTMVATGFAVAYRHYSSDYIAIEDSAKANKRGIWAGTFETPSDYRHDDVAHGKERAPGERGSRARLPHIVRAQPSEANNGCLIKGNQGSNGWIYHVPGMPYYSRTRAEQTFCSEAAAKAAGYRRAKAR